MVFVLNIGNTHVRHGFYEENEIVRPGFLPTEEFSTDQLPGSGPIAAASVVPEIEERFKNRPDVLWVSAENCGLLDLSRIDVETVGSDRLANAAALAASTRLPAICVDCGTAITFEVVDSNHTFLGGLIAPGRQLSRRALNDHTSQLPLIPLVEAIGDPIGTNTREAILSGTDQGTLCLVEGMVEKIRRALDADDCHVVITGGDARFFERNITFEVERDDDLTLKGIAAVWRFNNQ